MTMRAITRSAPPESTQVSDEEAREQLPQLLAHLRTSARGLTDREAARRLEADGPNELIRRSSSGLGSAILRQLIHPLALLLWLAAVLSAITGNVPLAAAIVVVIALNAVLAVVQERHAEQAVEALATYLPATAHVIRDGEDRIIPARELVRGDIVRIAEGERVSADARVLSGGVSIDMSMLTGESVPVARTAGVGAGPCAPIDAPDLLFSGTTCTQGNAVGVVLATGMRTEIGRIASLSQRVHPEASPLEQQVKRVAKMIAYVALGIGLAFVPIGTLAAGLPLRDAVTFAIGLLVANVPEGLLPTITLALAVGVRALARRGAIVKRISAVETLGSTSVICTDKTGTLTLNQMQVQRCWTSAGETDPSTDRVDGPTRDLLRAAAACTDLSLLQDGRVSGDPTEVALQVASQAAGASAPLERIAEFPFDPTLRRMTTIDRDESGVWAHTKGSPEDVLPLCATYNGSPLDPSTAARVLHTVETWAASGLRVLAVAVRRVDLLGDDTTDRVATEAGLDLLGLVGMIDPPRPEVRAAVERCHHAGIRLIVITGDHALTARGIATRVGIGDESTPVITGPELATMTEAELDELLQQHSELIFARSSPEAKLRVADALRSLGHVIAMTGDGVNDAPALRRADIGIAMGRSGTDVAREASTMILSDDDFATIVTAVESGRQVYDNVRKFIVYIFAHATPEILPFLLYALSGGRIPLPLTVMQILAIDLGTETLPALALGREPAEPGLMERPPRRRTQNVIDGPMLARAWGVLGGTSALLVIALFLATLVHGGWHAGADVSSGPLHHVWQQATTMSFLGIVACQIGTAVAARTQAASLRQVGLLTNPLLLWGIAFEVLFSAAVVTLEPLQRLFGTVAPAPWMVVALLPLPFITWGVDEALRAVRRARDESPSTTRGTPLAAGGTR
ncbi:cation-translocating P-type ATPase [Nocardioides nematodiphilus]|uniref:cation-translocating P-type ATPase n=1 Tax=Nocardioides nematodiphilus TaxID=2849669 RepID=UPI001CD9884A|nr:cation-transporting P-type ATPase [Nocardioides nematodiphilus]MCA1984753.1 cation-transporting P-type ATPase [Nocardioides nematodiphilus]